MNFIINFVTAKVLIVVDFWFTKNIGGRRLVGMRWWHMPSEEGGTTWRFEHRGLEDVRPVASYCLTCRPMHCGHIFISYTPLRKHPAVLHDTTAMKPCGH